MKNNKRKYQKLILSILAASTALYSCNSELSDEPDFSRKKFAEDKDKGTNLLPIDVYLGKDYIHKIEFMDLFVTNILSNKEEALAFNQNKNSILKKYHLDTINIEKNSPEIQILFALADKDILDAISKNDVKGYMEILKEKGLFQTEKFKRMISLIGDRNINSRVAAADREECICFAAAAIYVVLATVAETYVIVHSKFAMWGATSQDVSELMLEQVADTSVIKLWQLKGNNEHTYDIMNDLHNSLIQLSSELANKYNLNQEEQKTLLEITEGTITDKYNKQGEEK